MVGLLKIFRLMVRNIKFLLPRAILISNVIHILLNGLKTKLTMVIQYMVLLNLLVRAKTK